MTDILNDKQDKNDNLTSLSSLTGIPDGLAFFTGAGTMDMTALTQNGREILSKKNVSETLQYLTLGDGTGRLLGVQVFGSSGTYHKSPGVTKIIVEAVGGGGASGNLSATASNNCGVSAAGSNGAYAKAFFYQSIPESVQVTIGSGGVAGTGPGGSGGDGGNTSFGDLLVCPGGRGSTQVQQVPPFSGGSATEAPIPTGQGILFHSVSRSNLCGALGLGDDQAIGVESITTTMLGTYGIGGTGKYNKASSGPATGNNGNQGYILVWEYQ
ncbi:MULTISPECIES: glycine-rich domain-containing protein [Escherichia]